MREILTSPATLRVLFYLLAPILGMMPGVSVVGHIITINADLAFAGIAAGIVAGGGVFAAWGKK